MASSSSSCLLRREIVTFDGGLFEAVCDVCAVIVCCGEQPERLRSVRMELARLQPLRRVELYFFAGREACNGASTTEHDLSRNFKLLFEDALARRARRIMILEDDFQVPRPLLPDEVTSICAFLDKSQEDDDAVDVYGLGNLALPTLDTVLSEHQRAAFGWLTTAHACFYGARYMRTVLDFFEGDDVPADFIPIDHWPGFFKASAFRYCRPLVVQTFPATTNQRTCWNKTASVALVKMLMGVIKLVKLDERAQPGWGLIYFGTSYVFYLIVLLLLLLVAFFFWRNL